MQQGLVVDLSTPLSLSAARLSIDHSLPLADSVMLATARGHEATLWTQDADFEGLEDVRLRFRSEKQTLRSLQNCTSYTISTTTYVNR